MREPCGGRKTDDEHGQAGRTGNSAHKTLSPHESLSVSTDSTAQGDPRYPHACTKHKSKDGALRTE